MSNKKYRVEFRHDQYDTVGTLSINWERILSKVQTSFFSDTLERTDKRIYNQYIDGYTIFELTERQYLKFIKLIKNPE